MATAPTTHDVASSAARNVTRELAEFAVRMRFEDLSADLVHHVRRSTIDCLGVAVGATEHPSLPILLDTIEAFGGHPQATVWGTSRRTSIAWAALANGHLAHVLDYDDSYMPEVTILHGNAPVVPAALAVGEWLGASGAAYVLAFALGFEIEARIALSAGRAHYGKGWHVTSTVGAMGAAAAAGKLLALDEQQMTYALGIAGTQAGGLSEVLGSMSKGFHPGRAAMNGVLAAMLAQRGFTSAEDILTGRHGFHNVFPSDRNLAALVDDLGQRWELRRAAFKAFACGIVVQPMIEGLIRLRDEHRVRPDDVESVEARVNPFVLVPTGKTNPRSGLEGKFSVYHTAAVALIDGAAGPAQYTDERVLDPRVVELRQRVRIVPDEALRKDEAHVTLHLRDGRDLSHYVPHGIGTADNPLTDEQLATKFRSLVEPTMEADGVAQLLATLDRLERLSSVAELTEQLARRGV
jgi:2-methylcitrate dehydratase PrpD